MISKCLLLLVVMIYLNAAKSQDPDWDYQNTEEWGENYPKCNGNAQSPINLRRHDAFIKVIKPLKFDNYDAPLSDRLILRNNGHSVEVEIPDTVNGKRPSIRSGPLKGVYEAQSFHFHWGSDGVKGSEHAVNTIRHDIEVHIVHKNVRYATVEEALNHSDGLAVLGFFYDIDRHPENYDGLNNIFKKLPEVIRYNDNATIDSAFVLRDLLGDLDASDYFNYKGSLTTPPCSEAVHWIVIDDFLPVSKIHIEKFWQLLDKYDDFYENFRPLQERNGRIVYYNMNHKLWLQ